MTTIVAVQKSGSVCIAADTLARYGSAKESADYIANHDKLVSVGDAILAPAGPASVNLILKSYFKNPEHARAFGTLEEVFETIRELQAGLKENYFLNPKEDESDPYESIQMELLIASPGGMFGVYPLRSIQQYRRFYAFGSGAEYAMGAMHACYDQLDRPDAIAERALAAAACFDSSTALPLTSHTIELRAGV